MKAFIIIAFLQGIYYFLTGVWGVVDIESFMMVTGPKVDIWLVKTVSVLVIAISLVFLYAGIKKRITRETILLAVASAVGFIIIDVYYTAVDRISAIYLLDALAQLVLLAGWGIAYYQAKRHHVSPL
jgi:hypothetical protein